MNQFVLTHTESSATETEKNAIETFDLYKFIPPPNPLIQKNKYTESTPKSHLNLGCVRRVIGVENEEPQGESRGVDLDESLPNIPFYSVYEGKHIVYKRDSGREYVNINKVDKKSEIGTKEVESYYTPSENENTLIFESRFESGNLNLAVKVSDEEYNLLMQNDVNTRGHTQWFYFRTSCSQVGQCKFNILNFAKKDSLFNYGMKLLVYSETKNTLTGTGWSRDGESISYYRNNIKRGNGLKSYYTLTFTYNFQHKNDTVYFAYCYPYTYSHLMEDLQKVENLSIVNRKLLCLSIGGNRCDYLTITAPGTPEEVKARKGVVFTARVHPGETVGSWMMKGVINFLTSSDPEAENLRRNFVFKIVPMMNPDGVINGNYRCGLAGVDLNRRWKRPSEKLHPTIYHCKKLIKSFANERKIELICDFHGHSRRKNIFAYGCNIPTQPSLTRNFPYTLSKISKFFSYKFCSFRMQKSKEGTMRIALFKETKIPMIYTIESSFCGCESEGFGQDFKETPHFTTKHLETMGQDLCLALRTCFCGSDNGAVNSYLDELESNPELLEDKCSDSSGSDSDPSDDNLDLSELKSLYVNDKSIKKLKEVRKGCRTESRSKKEVGNRVLVSKNTVQVKEGKANCNSLVKASKKNTVGSAKVYGYRNLVYFNSNGRKVKDQATQTYRDEKGNLIGEYSSSDRSTNVSVVSNSDFERNNENSFILKYRNGLPSIGRNNKTFLNFIVGEKIRSKQK